MTAPGVAWPKVPPIPADALSQWRRLAAALIDREPCCSDDPELWFSRRPDEIEAACHRCLSCHAFVACRDYADAAHESLGVWGARDRTAHRSGTRATESDTP